MFPASYLLSLPACVLAVSVTQTRVAATGEFCHGWTDQRRNWREGFYCPEKDDRKGAVICCGRCEYRYCCSDGTARLDQGTCSDSDPDRKLPSKAEVVADEFSTGDYPVYVPFLIVGSAFLALLLFGGSACFLYTRQTSSASDSVAIGTTTTTTTTTTASCSSSTSLCPPPPIHGDQPRCRGDSCHVQRPCHDGQPGDGDGGGGGGDHPAAENTVVAAATAAKRPIAHPQHPSCVYCNGQLSQRAASPANPIAGRGYALTPTPTLVMAPAGSPHGFAPPSFLPPALVRSQASQHPASLAAAENQQHSGSYLQHSGSYPQHSVSYPQHFNTHPQSSSHSRAACPAQYATMPHPPGYPAHDTATLGPLPRLPVSPQQLPPGALFSAGSLLRGYILPSQSPTVALSPAAYRQQRIPSPPPGLTLTHHPLL